MKFSARLLGDGERLVLHMRTHIKRLISPAFFLLVIAALFGAGLALLPADLRPWSTYVLLGLAVLVLIPTVLVPFLRWLTTTYTITSRRIITRSGIINRQGHDIPLMRINDASYERPLIDRIFGCGTLLITTASERPVRLIDVPNIEEVHVMISELLFESGAAPTPPIPDE